MLRLSFGVLGDLVLQYARWNRPIYVMLFSGVPCLMCFRCVVRIVQKMS